MEFIIGAYALFNFIVLIMLLLGRFPVTFVSFIISSWELFYSVGYVMHWIVYLASCLACYTHYATRSYGRFDNLL